MNKFFLLPVIISMLAISGCARHTQIIIDPKGVDMQAYHVDLAECQHLADQIESKIAEGIVGGAVIGALYGAIIGGRRTSVTIGQLGALGGGLSAGAEEHYQRKKVIRNCLRNRGYQILN